uniref:Insulin n=1 Tax=Oryzias latipes TaxID=8090 RepID=A0A3P9K7S3_ORYLA
MCCRLKSNMTFFLSGVFTFSLLLCPSVLPLMARASWVLLTVILLIYSPGATSAPLQHLCGSHLVDALFFVCGDRGFFYNPHRAHKRDLGNQLGFLSKMARQQERLWRDQSGRDEPKVKRGIVEQCCHKPCSIHHLEGYCD